MKLIQEELFLVCLEALESGDSVEQILARYPDFVAELRPFLVTAVQLTQIASQPTLAAQQTSQQRFLQRVGELQTLAKPHKPRHRLRLILAPVASLIMLLLVGVSLITASNAALPGDALYGTKRLFESFQFTRTDDSETLQQQTQDERRREVDAVLQSDRNVWVEFEGTIEVMQEGRWLVSGIAVQVDSFTRIKGDLLVGTRVQVNGRIHEGILRALSVTVLTAGQSPTLTPTVPAVMETAVPTETAVPSPTPTIEPIQPTATVELILPTATAEPIPLTATAEPILPTSTTEPILPTATPFPNDNGNDDNANDNDDDNSNDNDNINDNDNDNSGDNNTNDHGGDDNNNNNGDDNANDNDDNANGNDDENDNDDNSGSGSDDNDNDSSGSGNRGGGDNDNDNGE